MRKLVVILIVTIFAGMSIGCGGPAVNQQALAEVQSIAVLGVSMTKADGDADNTAYLNKVASGALDAYVKELSAIGVWKVMSVAELRKNAAAKSLTNPETSNALKGAAAMLSKDSRVVQIGQMAAIGGGSANMSPEGLAKITALKVKTVAGKFAAAEGLANIPYTALSGAKDPGLMIDLGADITQKIMPSFLANVAKEMKVDAVGILTLRSFAGRVSDVRVSIGGKRVNGHIKMEPAFIIYTKSGARLIDFGWPILDDFATTKHHIPIFDKKSDKLDLDGDPKIDSAYKQLIEATSKKLAQKVKKAVAPPQ